MKSDSINSWSKSLKPNLNFSRSEDTTSGGTLAISAGEIAKWQAVLGSTVVPDGFYTAEQIAKSTGINYETTRNKLKRLADAGKVERVVVMNRKYYRLR